MQEFILFNLALFISVSMLLPWLFIVLAPLLLLSMITPLLLLNLGFNRNWKFRNYVLDTQHLKDMIVDHLQQWPEEVHAFARSTEQGGHFALSVNFTFNESKWNLQSHGLSLTEAVSRLQNKFKLSPIPIGFYLNQNFELATSPHFARDYVEFFPEGLCRRDLS